MPVAISRAPAPAGGGVAKPAPVAAVIEEPPAVAPPPAPPPQATDIRTGGGKAPKRNIDSKNPYGTE